MTLLEVNRAVCALVEQAAARSGTGAELSAEDLSRPILRPSVKIDLEESREAAAVEDRVEVEVTFRIYFFARDRSRPKLDNLAMRQALGRAFRDGVPVGEDVVPIDEGLLFTVTDGVLEAALDLRLDLEPETPAGDLMETLSQRYTTD
jgi:hypothetical protein|nr:MAG TPA_asm: hypothetical protein [Caudoviricetes sp.]